MLNEKLINYKDNQEDKLKYLEEKLANDVFESKIREHYLNPKKNILENLKKEANYLRMKSINRNYLEKIIKDNPKFAGSNIDNMSNIFYNKIKEYNENLEDEIYYKARRELEQNYETKQNELKEFEEIIKLDDTNKAKIEYFKDITRENILKEFKIPG